MHEHCDTSELRNRTKYQYDALKRLISAATTDPTWGLTFTYDGFGNRTDSIVTKGAGPAMSLLIDKTTNRVMSSGFSYDANGNLIASPLLSGVSYDVDNRLKAVNGDQYSYDHGNKRIWKRKSNGSEEFYFYGAAGEKIATYAPATVGSTLYMTATSSHVYFAGKLIREQNQVVVLDRLGSNRAGGKRYFPYGEEQTPTGDDKLKFATYYRDGNTGLDYADQRYYSSVYGRFTTVDPLAQPTLSIPGTWNLYSYGGDPINLRDVTGNRPTGVSRGDVHGRRIMEPSPAPDPELLTSPEMSRQLRLLQAK